MSSTINRPKSASTTRALPAPWILLAVVCAPPAILLAVLLVLIGVPLVVALVVPALIALAVAWWLLSTADSVPITGLRLQPVTEEEQPRLFNMVDGLCDSHGFRRPNLAMIDTDAFNSLVWGRRSGEATVAISRGWLDALSLLGLEGLLARELARANDPSLASATVAVSVARVLPTVARRKLFGQVCGAHRLILDDFEAVRATRYPPGLADALATPRDRSSLIVGVSPLSASLWASPPTAEHLLGAAYAPLDIRVDALREL